MYSLFNKELSVRSVSGGMRVPFRLFEGGADEHPLGEGVDKLMTSRHLCAIRLHERKTAMP